MARETYSVKFGQQQLLVGPVYDDGDAIPPSGSIFAAPCGITGLTRNVTTNTSDVALPPCDDPEAIIWLGIDAVSKRMTLTFTGTLADNALPVWDAWSMGNDHRWVRWYRNIGAPNQGYWEGPALLTEYSEESTDRGRYTNSGTIIFDGMPDWVSIPPAPSVTSGVSIPTTAPTEDAPFAATPGTYTGSTTPTYQWFSIGAGASVGVEIPSATSASYTPVAGDVGNRLYVVETATNASGSVNTKSATSLPVEPA